jgi:dTDP-4-dehydrorhamnose reductase
MNVNVNGTKNMIDAILELKKNTKFIYVSTACIFDGHTGMYKESSIPYPENFYALSKLLGEYEVKKLENHLIVRTNFVSKGKWPYPKAFTDRFGTYLFANQVAEGLKEISESSLTGFIHIVGDKKISMFDLAKMTTPEIIPMTINDYSGPRLTIDMTLDTERWKKYKISS